MVNEKDQRLVEQYIRETGRDPRNLPEDHPDHWQWNYRGTKEEREALATTMGLTEDRPVIEGQEELF